MSCWAHIAATARIDAIMVFEENPGSMKDAILAHFGKPVHWEDDSEIWDDAEKNPDKYLPMGSEGSLDIDIWQNPDANCMNAFTVSIFGDLRDRGYTRDELNTYIEWFKNKLNEFAFRQAVITATNGTDTVTWAWEGD